jgi:pimeloyl-ACP methyl ester carboxylesterase
MRSVSRRVGIADGLVVLSQNCASTNTEPGAVASGSWRAGNFCAPDHYPVATAPGSVFEAALVVSSFFAVSPAATPRGLPALGPRHRRVALENVGHFPHREAPRLVADAALNHFHHD